MPRCPCLFGSIRLLPLALTALTVGGLATAAAAAQGKILVSLEGAAFDMEADLARRRLYVSVPSKNEIVVISTATWQVVNRIVVEGAPHGLDLSLDGSRLLVALHQRGALAFVDLQTFAQTTVDIREQLGEAHAFDVIEARPGRVFVSGDTRTFGVAAWIIMVKTDEGNVASREVSEHFGLSPRFARSPDGRFLYVGHMGMLHKLDISTDDLSVADVTSVSFGSRLTLSPDGEQVYTGGGDVLRTSDFAPIGFLTGLDYIPKVSADGERAYMTSGYAVAIHETVSFSRLTNVTLPCLFGALRDVELLDNGAGLVVLGDDQLCGISTSASPPATCRLAPAYAGGTLTLNFDLGTPRPATWNLWISVGSATTKVWQYSLPVVAPFATVRVPIPSFPSVGRVGFWNTLTTSQGTLCSDFEMVETGGPPAAVSPQTLRSLITRERP